VCGVMGVESDDEVVQYGRGGGVLPLSWVMDRRRCLVVGSCALPSQDWSCLRVVVMCKAFIRLRNFLNLMFFPVKLNLFFMKFLFDF
jgi:hypothetical protein